MAEVTQDRLKELLHYDPETGVFTWKKSRSHLKAGSIAGSYSWKGYRIIKIDRVSYPAHRLVFLYLHGKFPSCEVDHVNGIKDDNRINQLRQVTSRENAKNRKMSRNNTSGVHGVSWCSHTNKWKAEIRVNRKSRYLGVYNELSDAAEARRLAEIKYGFHQNHGRLA